jgi:hypothetical protein
LRATLVLHNPKGVVALNREKFHIPISFKNLTVVITLRKNEKRLYNATDFKIGYEDISFDFGFLSYLVPDALIRTETVLALVKKAEYRALEGFNKFLASFNFLKFKGNSIIIDCKDLYTPLK